jgi:hypothetical protein
MRDYESNEDERRYFDLVDPDSGCTRNLVDQGNNSKSNLVSLRYAIIRATQSLSDSSFLSGHLAEAASYTATATHTV